MSGKNDEYDIEQSLGFLLSKCHQRAFQIFREKLLPYSLTPPQFAVLAFLWKQDGQSQIELGTAIEADRTTISGVVDRLEKQGLVNRLPHPEDRRVFMIYLTAAGRELEYAVSRLSRKASDAVAANLSTKEKETLLVLLKKIRGVNQNEK